MDIRVHLMDQETPAAFGLGFLVEVDGAEPNRAARNLIVGVPQMQMVSLSHRATGVHALEAPLIGLSMSERRKPWRARRRLVA